MEPNYSLIPSGALLDRCISLMNFHLPRIVKISFSRSHKCQIHLQVWIRAWENCDTPAIPISSANKISSSVGLLICNLSNRWPFRFFFLCRFFSFPSFPNFFLSDFLFWVVLFFFSLTLLGRLRLNSPPALRWLLHVPYLNLTISHLSPADRISCNVQFLSNYAHTQTRNLVIQALSRGWDEKEAPHAWLLTVIYDRVRLSTIY